MLEKVMRVQLILSRQVKRKFQSNQISKCIMNATMRCIIIIVIIITISTTHIFLLCYLQIKVVFLCIHTTTIPKPLLSFFIFKSFLSKQVKKKSAQNYFFFLCVKTFVRIAYFILGFNYNQMFSYHLESLKLYTDLSFLYSIRPSFYHITFAHYIFKIRNDLRSTFMIWCF